MTLRREYSLGHSEFNDFLFATLGEEKSGLELTVLSALTRLDLDPWGEAARLSALPEEAAVRALAAVVALLPEGNWKAADSGTIAARLVSSLPKRQAPKMPQAEPTGKGKKKPTIALWAVAAVVIALFLGVSYLPKILPPEPTAAPVTSVQH
jgi:hypothetical protein